MNERIARTLSIGLVAVGMLAAAGATMAAGDMKAGEKPTGPIAERQAAMKTVVKNFKQLVGMVKGEIPFDATAVKTHAETIVAALKKARGNFPDGSDEGETRAKPEIWLMKDEFDAQFDKTIGLAEALRKVASKDQLPPAVMALGGQGCKACHEKFRLPKKN